MDCASSLSWFIALGSPSENLTQLSAIARSDFGRKGRQRFGAPCVNLAAVRLWSLHPRYLDRQGLVALWREGLLAQKVLAGKTRGYRHHPQLLRFRGCRDPLAAIGSYLSGVASEAECRGYRFDRSKIRRCRVRGPKLTVTRAQLAFETSHLLAKLARRDPPLGERWAGLRRLEPHPSFRVVAGGIAAWERAYAAEPPPMTRSLRATRVRSSGLR
jgi:hypothetical protein